MIYSSYSSVFALPEPLTSILGQTERATAHTDFRALVACSYGDKSEGTLGSDLW